MLAPGEVLGLEGSGRVFAADEVMPVLLMTVANSLRCAPDRFVQFTTTSALTGERARRSPLVAAVAIPFERTTVKD